MFASEHLLCCHATLTIAFCINTKARISDNPEDIPPPDAATFNAPPPPNSIEEALQQRLAKYKQDEEKAKEEGNSSRMRRLGRICKQYEDALKLHKKGKLATVLADLPCPPGFAPIPMQAGSVTATTSVAGMNLVIAQKTKVSKVHSI